MAEGPPARTRGSGSSINRLAEAHRELDSLRTEVRDLLRQQQLAGALSRASGWREASASDLRLAGLVPEALELFADPTDPESFRPLAPRPAASLVVEDPATPIRAIRLQVPSAARGVSLGLKIVRDLVGSLDPSTEVLLLVRPGVRPEAIKTLWRGWSLDPGRLRLVEHATTTLFAQDNGKGARVGRSQALLRPLRGKDSDDSLPMDRERLGVEVLQSRLQWDGGNLLRDAHSTLVGVNTIALNMLTAGLTAEQVARQIESESGAPPLILGDLDAALEALIARHQGDDSPGLRDGGQADFHIDLDVCPLGEDPDGRPRVAIADPLAGLEHAAMIERDARRFDGHFVPAQRARSIFRAHLDASTERRTNGLDLYRRQLRDAGYSLVSVPDLRIARHLDYLNRCNFTFNYVNALPGCHDGRSCVRSFVYGIAPLDEAAAAAYEAAGVEMLPVGDEVTADELFGLDGGPHCVASRME